MALPRDTTGWNETEVQQVFAAAKSALIAGEKIVSWSSAGSSVSKTIQDMTPGDVLAWSQWMLRALNPETYGHNRNRSVAVYY